MHCHALRQTCEWDCQILLFFHFLLVDLPWGKTRINWSPHRPKWDWKMWETGVNLDQKSWRFFPLSSPSNPFSWLWREIHDKACQVDKTLQNDDSEIGFQANFATVACSCYFMLLLELSQVPPCHTWHSRTGPSLNDPRAVGHGRRQCWPALWHPRKPHVVWREKGPKTQGASEGLKRMQWFWAPKYIFFLHGQSKCLLWRSCGRGLLLGLWINRARWFLITSRNKPIIVLAKWRTSFTRSFLADRWICLICGKLSLILIAIFQWRCHNPSCTMWCLNRSKLQLKASLARRDTTQGHPWTFPSWDSTL